MKVWRSALALLLLVSSSCLRMQGPPKGDAPCSTSNDCGLDEFCNDGQCVSTKECESSGDCPRDLVCQGSRCVTQECSASDQSACVPYRCAGSTCLNSCTSQDDCAGVGTQCVTGRCEEPDCRIDADCRGYQCQAFRCATSCDFSGYGCASGYACLQGQCSIPLDKAEGASCSLDGECASRVCCFVVGSPSGHCANDCHTRPDGIPCNTDESCISGQCSNGICSTCGTQQCGYVNGVLCGSCPEGFVCNGAACQEQTCDPSLQYVCKDNSFYECNQGSVGGFRTACGDTAFCEINSGRCVPYTCEPNLGFCDGGTYRPCNETGHDAGGPERKCELLGLQCSSLGCGNQHIEDVPSQTGNRTGLQSNTCGNLFLADKPYSLLSMSQTMEANGGEIRWFVYGADALDGTYASELAQAFVTSPVPYSPELHVTLVPGRYYFIGAQVVAGASYSFDPALADPPPMAFGHLIDSFCLLNGLNATLKDRQQNGVAVQQIESVELVP